MIHYPKIKVEFQGLPVEVTRNESASWPCWTCVVPAIDFVFELETQHRNLESGDGYWSTSVGQHGFLDHEQAHDAASPQESVDALVEHMSKLHDKLTKILSA